MKRSRRYAGAVMVLALALGSLAAGEPTGTFRAAIEPIVQVDPAFISSDAEVVVASHVFDYLVDVDEDNQIVPRLARSWEKSEDGLTYTFQLHEGVTFHDGSPLSAADVVWTFDRLRDPDLGLHTSDLYESIEGIEAVGDHEVVFRLEERNPFFLYDLSDNKALVVREGTEQADDFNGTGPFIVDYYGVEDRVELVANPDYFLEGLPKLERLEFIFFGDAAAAVDALRGGQV
ncbi:MAG: ABC transporter substrate-binding protein, partial [Candidatus Bipolaricaulota bacterium]